MMRNKPQLLRVLLAVLLLHRHKSSNALPRHSLTTLLSVLIPILFFVITLRMLNEMIKLDSLDYI